MGVPHVSVDDLHQRLGIATPLDLPLSSKTKPLQDWKMEVDDAIILRYLYRNLRPRRHLEFGTWQGAGALLCLQECDATVWTMNLPEGEHHADGEWAYSRFFSLYTGQEGDHPQNLSLFYRRHPVIWRLLSMFRQKAPAIPGWSKVQVEGEDVIQYQTDSLGFIGRQYLEAGLGHRVCQIFCDSRQWDTSNYPSDFFDTVLIDGGHTEAVVKSDSRKACEVVRSGGIVLWHDFCPFPAVQSSCSSTVGVVNAIEQEWEWLSSQMREIFWIKPSWILLGVKR